MSTSVLQGYTRQIRDHNVEISVAFLEFRSFIY